MNNFLILKKQKHIREDITFIKFTNQNDLVYYSLMFDSTALYQYAE